MRDAISKARRSCDLWGLAVDGERYLMGTPGRLFHFCCPGCRQAYVISRALRDPGFPSTPPTVGEPHDA